MISSRDADICKRYGEGEKLDAIGERWGLTKQRVQQVAKRAGLPKRNRFRGPKPPPRRTPFGHLGNARRNLEVLARWDAGFSARVISEDLGLSLGQVRGVLERYVAGRAKHRPRSPAELSAGRPSASSAGKDSAS